MRRLTAIGLALMLSIIIAGPAAAAGGGHGKFLSPHARVHGHTLADLAAAWAIWGLGTSADDNPLLAGRCEQSPIDPRIWFLPVSFEGEVHVDCTVPKGAFLVYTAGAYECSEAEGNGSTEAQLRACADEGFATFTTIEASVDGKQATDVGRNVVTSPLYELPGPNLFSDEATPSLIKGVFMVVRPLKPGEHTVRGFAEATGNGFSAGMTYHITVPKKH
jgi:hypothetical protein